eukprot:8793111-Alexandrium_andersonii.AAC.1
MAPRAACWPTPMPARSSTAGSLLCCARLLPACGSTSWKGCRPGPLPLQPPPSSAPRAAGAAG